MISQAAALPTQVLMPSIVCRKALDVHIQSPPRRGEFGNEQSTIRPPSEWCFAVSVCRQIGDFAFGPK